MNLKENEINLYNKYRDGDQFAKKELLASLDPLIRKQVNKFNGSGLPEIAVRIEGYKLASTAIDSYDPTKSQLNTHVTNYLKKLSRFVTNYQNIGHIPEPRALMIGKYHTIYSNLESDKGREPTVIELSDALQIPIAEVERLQSELRNDLSLTIEDDDDEGGGGFYKFVNSEFDPRIVQAIDTVYFESDPVEQKIIEYTLGWKGSPKYKSKDIALKLNLKDAELKNKKTEIAKQIDELI